MKKIAIFTLIIAFFLGGMAFAETAFADDENCIQVITYGLNPETGQWEEFPTPCDVPDGWKSSMSVPEGYQAKPEESEGLPPRGDAEPVIAPSPCIQVITYGKNPETGQWIEFPTPCDVPEGWETTTEAPENYQPMTEPLPVKDPETEPVAEEPEANPINCIQVITYGKNPETGQWIAFPTPCDVPEGWESTTEKPEDYEPVIAPSPNNPDGTISIDDPFGLAEYPQAADLINAGGALVMVTGNGFGQRFAPGDSLGITAAADSQAMDYFDAHLAVQTPQGALSFLQADWGITGLRPVPGRPVRSYGLNRGQTETATPALQTVKTDRIRFSETASPVFKKRSQESEMPTVSFTLPLFPGTMSGSYSLWFILTTPGTPCTDPANWLAASRADFTVEKRDPAPVPGNAIQTIEVVTNGEAMPVQLSRPVSLPLNQADAILIQEESGCGCFGTELSLEDGYWTSQCCDAYPDCRIRIHQATGQVECDLFG